ncbi:MAG: transcriptional repressor [Anaerolineales bacterium]|nr:transcriptional repressor [Anaerolineales bacterium]
MKTLSPLPQPDLQARLDNLIQRLKEHGCRITPQRMAVLKIMLTSEEHPTVEEVYNRVRSAYPMTSMATIYKTVALLKEMGEVMEIGMGHGSNRYDGLHPEPHLHMICTSCNSITDIEASDLIAMAQEKVRASGFQLSSQRLDFFGICAKCQALSNPNGGAI